MAQPLHLPADMLAPPPAAPRVSFHTVQDGATGSGVLVGSALRVGARYLVADAHGSIVGEADSLALASAIAHAL